MSRTLAREVAMKLAFALLLGGENTYDAVLDQSGIDDNPSEKDLNYAAQIVEGVESIRDELDARIEKAAIGWSIERMPRVDISILRIALYEMLHRDDVPPSVAINEAVELAKRFGGDRSAGYINGILGTLARQEGVEGVPEEMLISAENQMAEEAAQAIEDIAQVIEETTQS